MKTKSKLFLYLILCCTIILSAAFLGGCKGDTGAPGLPGAAGQNATTTGTVALTDMTAEEAAGMTMTGTVNSVTIASPPVVNFTVTDQDGRGITGLGLKPTTSLSYMRFALAKLVPGTTSAPSKWVAYTGVTSATSRPSTENNGTIVDHGNGSYTYTFTTNLVTAATFTNQPVYEPSLTHRLVIQISGTLANTLLAFENPVNIIHDFVPAGGAVATQRDIVTAAACNECHGKIGVTTPHGGRVDTRYCVVCHTDQRRNGRTVSAPTGTGLLSGSTYLVNDQASGNFPNMIHKIHMGSDLGLQGYNYAGVEFNHIGYPQQKQNCRKCHKGDTAQQLAAAPQGNNWKMVPSRLACGGCHDNVYFDTAITGFVAHSGGTGLTSDASCATCHPQSGGLAGIEDKHLTENATTNNPSVPTGAVNFTYEIKEVSTHATNTTNPVIKFRILKDGVKVTFDGVYSASSPTNTSNPLQGFTGAPSFLIAYAAAQDGATALVDYNNYGNINTTGSTGTGAGQPASVSISALTSLGTWTWTGNRGTISAPDADGYYTATITSSGYGFPVGSKLRAVALQGYFTQSGVEASSGIDFNDDGDLLDGLARHTVAVVKNHKDDTSSNIRRSVVDNAKCANCHEWFEGHGGNRVYTTEVCVMCHNPNLSSSGRGGNPANLSAEDRQAMIDDGIDPDDPLNYPEASNNFKDLIHGIHASNQRETPFQFVRDRGTSGVFYYNWSHVTFPGILSNCETCHKAGTAGNYDGDLPTGVFVSTYVTGGNGLASAATVTAARKSVPNAADLVTSPFVATCIPCHDSVPAVAHMDQNGAQRMLDRTTAVANQFQEGCTMCHGAGRSADPATVHK